MRKKILILGHNAATQFIDVFNQYVRVFDADQYEVTVAYLTGEQNEEVKQRTLSEQVIFFNIPSKELRGLKIKAIKTVAAFCKKNQFDMVICHRYKPTYIMLLVNIICPIPKLLFVMHEMNTMSSWGRKLLTGALSSHNMMYAGVSNAVCQDMQNDMHFVSKEKITTLYNMIDIDLFEPQLLSRDKAREALKIDKNAFVFGNIARLAPNKDQYTLIQAFAKWQQKHEGQLIILGNGELEMNLKREVDKLDLQNKIIFLGFIPNAFRYMKAFDCFILSSIQEAFGRVLLEAMIARVPIIATRVNGIPEVVQDVGVLIDKKNSDQLSEAMEKIKMLSETEKNNMTEKAYLHVSHVFSIEAFKKVFWNLPVHNKG